MNTCPTNYNPSHRSAIVWQKITYFGNFYIIIFGKMMYHYLWQTKICLTEVPQPDKRFNPTRMFLPSVWSIPDFLWLYRTSNIFKINAPMMYLTTEITLLVHFSKLQYHSATQARSYHKHFDIKPSTYLTRSKSDSTTIIHTWNHRAIHKFNLFFILPNTPGNVNTPGKSPKSVPYEYIKIQVHRKAVCVCILIVDPVLIFLPLDEPLVALGGYLPADEEEFPE